MQKTGGITAKSRLTCSADDNSSDNDGDGYTNVEEYLNGTDPTEFVDYTKPENNVNMLEKSRGK